MTTNAYTSFKTKKPKIEKSKSFAPPMDNDGAAMIIDTPNSNGNSAANAAGFFGTYLDIEGNSRTESDMIRRYREVAAYPECDMAIEDIVNEAISDLEQGSVVEMDLGDIKISESLKNKMHTEFKTLVRLLDFDLLGHNIFKRWYIDGRIYFHKIVDQGNPSAGIKELRYLDPRKMKKIIQVAKTKDNKSGIELYGTTNEYFLYTQSAVSSNAAQFQFQGTNNAVRATKIPSEEIAYVTSGEIDYDQHLVLSYLHKALKIVNQVRMMEDSLVIYRLSRAPERRIFYVDTGGMTKPQGEAHIKNLMTMYRNKTVYDAATGQVRDDRKFSAMIEDFWIPRQGGNKSTEVDTLPGGENLDSIGDIQYFQKNLYKALNVPVSRLSSETNLVSFGRQSEVNRDELKFSKFVQRLRRKFSELFRDMLKTQLILKNIFTEEDWNNIVSDIKFVFSQDSYYAEAKETEILRNRMDILEQVSPYVGIFFDRDFVFKKILRMTDEEISEINKGINKDQEEGFFGVVPEQERQQIIGQMMNQPNDTTNKQKPNNNNQQPAPLVQNQP